MKKFLVLVVVAMALVLAQNAMAVCSGMPDAFYGTIKINGNDAPAGTQIRGILDGEVKGTYTTSSIGAYGNPDTDEKLYVYGWTSGRGYYNSISFEVYMGSQWVAAEETSIYECGLLKELALTVDYQAPNDADGDGYVAASDCNDNNAAIHPGATELCDGIDNDCDLSVDEGFGLGASCSVGVGACQASGVFVCTADDTASECSAVAGSPAAELCDGIDNDCDGSTDEDFGLGDSCSLGVGACQASGVFVCTADDTASECSAAAGSPAAELCDGIDNDCDGSTDEGFGLGDSCSVGVGACQASGVLVCTADDTASECNAIAGTPAAELCDGIDNDCDGSVDEDVKTIYYQDADADTYGNALISTEACAQPQGYVLNSDDCNDDDASVNPAADEVCDGIDNDCDAATVDGVSEPGYGDSTSCGIGSCFASGVYTCQSGSMVDTCSPGAPVAEVCDNGDDDDCDGSIDMEDSYCNGTPDDDTDGDGVIDEADNCQSIANPGQEDTDNDGIGNACDTCPNDPLNDADADGVCGNLDNCPSAANPTQLDADADGNGDACDACPNDPLNDADADGVCGNVDNCPSNANPGQEDSDADGIGNACDTCANDPLNDVDADGVCGNIDNCQGVYNPNQLDSDLDGAGDACEICDFDTSNDVDADGVCGNVDNCPSIANADQIDSDADGTGDACDVCANDPLNDVDADGVCGNADNCADVSNPSQADADSDGMGDACDAYPNDPNNVREVTVQVYDGWTLFALPYMPIGIDNSEELGQAIMADGVEATCDVIMRYDGAQQKMVDDILGMEDPSFALSGTEGYFIHCNKAISFTYTGTYWG